MGFQSTEGAIHCLSEQGRLHQRVGGGARARKTFQTREENEQRFSGFKGNDAMGRIGNLALLLCSNLRGRLVEWGEHGTWTPDHHLPAL